jgi:spore germination cell wall hydrolase CwlJ-like protein
MSVYGKLMSAAIGVAALSGTLLVPSSKLLASPAPVVAAAEAPSPVPTVSAAPAVLPAPEAEAVPAAPQAPVAAAQPAEEEAQAAISDRELQCMTKVILYEAGAESRAGQVAVAQVVMNRAKSGRFPKTVCGVVYQPGQFSSIRSYKAPAGARWERAEAIAREVMTGEAESGVGKALYFHATRVSPAYVRSRTRVATIGNHVFYR